MNSIHTNIQSARFKKGDAFVQCDYVSITFMEINEVDQSTDSMDFCTVTWYCCEKEGVNIQRRFPMLLLKVSSVTSSQSLETFSKRLKA